MNLVLQLLHFFLRFQEIGGNRVVHELFTKFFELHDFVLLNLHAVLLHLLEQGTAVVEHAVLILEFLVVDERLNLFIKLGKAFLVHDGFAQLFGAVLDG